MSGDGSHPKIWADQKQQRRYRITHDDGKTDVTEKPSGVSSCGLCHQKVVFSGTFAQWRMVAWRHKKVGGEDKLLTSGVGTLPFQTFYLEPNNQIQKNPFPH